MNNRTKAWIGGLIDFIAGSLSAHLHDAGYDWQSWVCIVVISFVSGVFFASIKD